MIELKEVLKNYENHPEFFGVDLLEVNQKGLFDNTPLHIAAQRGDVEDIEVLIAHGANINQRGDLGFTPLHGAALTGKAAAAKKLLELGANPTLLNEFSQTALKVAQLGDKHDVIEILQNWKT